MIFLAEEWHQAWRPGLPRDVVFTIPEGAQEGAPLIVEARVCGGGVVQLQNKSKGTVKETGKRTLSYLLSGLKPCFFGGKLQ